MLANIAGEFKHTFSLEVDISGGLNAVICAISADPDTDASWTSDEFIKLARRSVYKASASEDCVIRTSENLSKYLDGVKEVTSTGKLVKTKAPLVL